MKVRYRRQAQLDIDHIHEYIEKRNPRAATEVVAAIRRAIDRLGLWPRMGHIGRAPETYEWVVVRTIVLVRTGCTFLDAATQPHAGVSIKCTVTVT